MSEVKWIKITTNMFEDEKIDFIESLPEADAILIIWIKLLTLAGKCNANGFIFLTEKIPYTEEMLAHKFRRPLNVVKLAFEILRKLEMIEFNDDGFLKITNWEKHQNVEGLEKIREQTRKRVAKHRAKKALAESEENDVTLHVTLRNAIDIDKDIDKDKKEPPTPYKQIQDLFNNICKSYPKVISIGNARKQHLQARWRQFNCDISMFEKAFQKLENSEFCKGCNNRSWKAGFDWIIGNDENMIKVLEGKYDDKRKDEIDKWPADSRYGW